MPAAPNDLHHMRAALGLAERGLGMTWPNPSVGCVIVHQGCVVGQGHTAPGGRPHAEPQALAMAGNLARGATAYVTLEPCCHWGQSPPCTEALIGAGIARVVIGAADPDPRVDRQGIARLRAVGIEVETGVLEQEASETLQGFILRVAVGRPLVTLKLATTMDGRIATSSGESKWITGPLARSMAHVLRGRHDAVMAGAGTVVADDPELTCRIPGFRPTPVVRVIADSGLRTPLTARLLLTARDAPSWFIMCADADAERQQEFRHAGANLIAVAAGPGGVDIAAAMRALAEAGLTRVLIEGGSQLAASLLRADLVDCIAWFHAGAIIGGDGRPGVQALGIEKLAMMPRFRRTRITELGEDVLSEFTRRG